MTAGPPRETTDGALPFLRPGPLPLRDTLAGWEQYRAARGSFVPAPRLDLASWRALPPKRRMLHDRPTNGVVGLLERLIEDGCREAIDTGAETLTQDILDSVTVNITGAPGRDPAAGEIPAVPPKPPGRPGQDGASSRPRRGRNTVFDERGPAAAAEAGA